MPATTGGLVSLAREATRLDAKGGHSGRWLVDALTAAIREALSNLRKEFKMTTTPMGTLPVDEETEKFLGFLGPVLTAVLPSLLGAIGQAVSGQGKSILGPDTWPGWPSQPLWGGWGSGSIWGIPRPTPQPSPFRPLPPERVSSVVSCPNP
jgi:hypothetical protein